MEGVDPGSWASGEQAFWGVGGGVGRERDSGVPCTARVRTVRLPEQRPEGGDIEVIEGFHL